MSDISKDLNQEQRQAVTTTEGPLLIIAGAGTGKTTVIARRIAYIIEKKLANPQILIISGVRRCGKSTLLHDIRSKQTEQDYFLNFDDDRLTSFQLSDFQTLFESFIELFGEQKHFYFDEIQLVKGWERFIRRLHDNHFVIFITGSNQCE